MLHREWNALDDAQRHQFVGDLKFMYLGHGILVFYDSIDEVPSFHKSNLYLLEKDGQSRKLQFTFPKNSNITPFGKGNHSPFDDDHDLDDIEDFYDNVDDELEPICSVCHKPISFFDFANHGKCKECRGDS